MLTPVLKFSEIKKNPSLMTRLRQAAVVRYGDVVAYVVSPERMEELLAAEEQYENGYLNGVADSRVGQKRIHVDLDNIKAGDNVRIKSLKNTYNHYGASIGMLSIADVGLVADVFGSCVEIGAFKYHIDDLELIK